MAERYNANVPPVDTRWQVMTGDEVDKEKLERSLRLVTLILSVGASSSIVLYGLVYVQERAWQLLAEEAFIIFALICAGIASWLTKRERYDLAGYALVAGVFVAYGGGELVWKGGTFFLGFGGVLLLLLVSTAVLPRKWVAWLTIVMLYSFYIWGVNQLSLFPRFDVRDSSLLYNSLIGVTLSVPVVILGVVIQAFRIGNIQTRLMISFVAMALLPGIVSSSASAVVGLVEGRERVADQLQSAATLREEQIDDWLGGLRQNLVVELNRELAYLNRVLLSPSDSAEYEAARRLLRLRFQETLGLREEFNMLFLMDRSGRVVLSTDTLEEGQSYGDETYFIEGLHGFYISAPRYEPALEGLGVVAVYPVLNNRGRVVGVLAGRASMEPVEDVMADPTGLGETGEAYLVQASDYSLLTPLRSGANVASVRTVGVRRAIEAEASDVDQYVNYEGERVVGVYRWLPELQVALIAEIEQATVVRTALSTITVNLGVTFLAVGIAIAGALFLTRNIAGPITDLVETAQDVAAGDLTQRAEVQREDEIGLLAVTFNSMTGQLQETIEGLEVRIAERTADLEQRSAQLEAAAQVSRQVASIRSVDELLQTTVNQISQRFGFYHAGIFIIDDRRKFAVLKAASSEGGARMLARGHKLAVGEVGIVGDVAATGQPRIALDVGADAQYFNNVDLPETHSEMALPLQVRDELFGVLDVQSIQSGAFTSADIAILQTMADQVALAINNANLLSQAEARLDEISQLLRSQSREGWGRMMVERPDLNYLYDGTEVRSGDVRSFDVQMEMPLEVRQESIGKLSLRFPDRQPSPQDRALVEAILEQAGEALDSARLFREVQTALDEVGVLYQGSRAIGAAQNLDDILRAFVDYMVTPQIDRVVLVLFEEGSLNSDSPTVCVKAAWEASGEIPSPVLGNCWNVSQIPMMRERFDEVMVFEDVSADPSLDETSRHILLNILQIRAFLLVPLIVGGQLLGWVMAESLDEPYEFTERETRLYRSLADQAAVVLRSIRLFEAANRRAERERKITQISAQVRASTDIEVILRNSIRELGRALKASDGLIRLGFGVHRTLPDTGPLDEEAVGVRGEESDEH